MKNLNKADRNNSPEKAQAPEPEANRIIKGIGVSAGVAIGQAVVIERLSTEIYPQRILDPEGIDVEVQRFERAVEEAADQLKQIKKTIHPGHALDNHLYIFDTHILLLEDRMFFSGTKELIASGRQNAEWALSEIIGRICSAFDTIEDEYLRERARDIRFVGERVLRILMGHSEDRRSHELPPNSIIIAHDLSPADTAQFQGERAIGFAIDMGGRTSHTAIMARSLKIPAVTGVDRISSNVQTGDTVIIDGSTGIVIVDPDGETIYRYRDRQQVFLKYQESLMGYGALPAVTADGERSVRILANVELMDEIEIAQGHGAEGIGLFRTEYLFLGRRDLPDEEEQYQVYREVLEANRPHPVTIRTLDAGADKVSSALNVGKETNPAMGLRAIRLCLQRRDLFRTQLRAILRAAVHGNCRILFPMISCLTELTVTKAFLEEVKRELAESGELFNPDVKVGVLVEVPSAVTIADLLAKEADFLSIGTNDLIQYSFAIDRLNEHVNYLYDTLHPAVIRLIRQVTTAAHASGIAVAMCGEMAGDPLNVPILLGLGLDELSMNALSIPMVKKFIRSMTIDECRELTNEALQMQDRQEIHDFLESWIRERFPDDVFALHSRQTNDRA